MTWTYAGAPTTPKDEVRFYLQDVVASRPLLQDEEIDYLLDTYGARYSSNVAVAAIGADVLSGRFATQVSMSADGVSAGFDQLQAKFKQLGDDLRDQYGRLAGSGVEPYAGGLERFEVPDMTVKPHQVAIGMHDNPAAGRQDAGDWSAVGWGGWYPWEVQ